MAEQIDLPPGFTAGGSVNPEEEAKRKEMAEYRESMLSQILQPAARERLKRLSLVKPEKAQAVENQLITMAQKRQLPGPVSEANLVKMLEDLGRQQAASSTVKVDRKKYLADDDDYDDNDDDLL